MLAPEFIPVVVHAADGPTVLHYTPDEFEAHTGLRSPAPELAAANFAPGDYPGRGGGFVRPAA